MLRASAREQLRASAQQWADRGRAPGLLWGADVLRDITRRVPSGAPLAELRNDASEFPNLTFSSDGRWLATTGGADVRVFDTQTWRPALTIRGPGIRYLAFDPTSPHLLTGAATGDVSLWAIPGGVRVHHLRKLGEPISAVAFSPDGQFVAAASHDGAEQVWHAGSRELQSQLHPRHSRIPELAIHGRCVLGRYRLGLECDVALSPLVFATDE